MNSVDILLNGRWGGERFPIKIGVVFYQYMYLMYLSCICVILVVFHPNTRISSSTRVFELYSIEPRLGMHGHVASRVLICIYVYCSVFTSI